MKKITTLYLIIVIFFISCSKGPGAKMTDTYIEVVKPGDAFGLAELTDIKIDSAFGYPASEKETIGFTIVNRNTHKKLDPEASVKMFFSTRNDRYCWRVSPDIFSAQVYYADTIYIKPNTWYRLSTQRNKVSVYFFLDKITGTYINKFKPFPGAY